MKVELPYARTVLPQQELHESRSTQKLVPGFILFHLFPSSTVPDQAHFLCQDFESAVRLAAEPPLAGIIETIWVLGGTQVYEVNQIYSLTLGTR